MQIIWTKEALNCLEHIEEYIARDSSERAQDFVEFLVQQSKSIQNNPHIGRIVPELSNPSIREIIIKKYRMVYQLNENTITILTVFEGHKLLKIR